MHLTILKKFLILRIFKVDIRKKDLNLDLRDYNTECMRDVFISVTHRTLRLIVT